MNIVEGEEDMVWGQTNMRQIDDQGQKDVEQMDMKIEEQAEGHDEDDQFGDFEESHTLV